MHQRDVHRELTRELAAQADDGLIHEGLADAVVEQVLARNTGRRRTVVGVVNNAVSVVVILDVAADGGGAVHAGDVVTAVHLLVHPTEVAAQNIPAVFRELVGEPGAGAER